MKVNFLKFFSVMFLVVLYVGASSGEEQQVKAYSGKVVNSETLEGLSNVGIKCVDSNYSCASTLSDGSFTCYLACSRVRVSHIGYKAREFSLDETTGIVIELEPAESESLETVTVVDKKPEFSMKTAELTGAKEQFSKPRLSEFNLAKELCESEYDGKKGEWDSENNTCKCPNKMVWQPNIQKCEDAGFSELEDACWSLVQKKLASWDENIHKCTCLKKGQEFKYDESNKKGSCVKVKKDEPKTEPVKQTTKPKERTEEEKAAALAETKTAYNDARDNEHSSANKALTSVTTLATGLGAMQAAQGWAEQKADKKADEKMDAYLETFRCTYGNGKSVKWGPNEIELPGGNDETIAKYRNEYMSLVASLKERKESLNMKPGIESEVVLDKAEMGLYDDENVGITGGAYSSLYRAKALGSEKDQTKISDEQSKSANRLKYGAIAAGAGVAVGLIGNSVINGKIGEKIKEIKNDINYRRNEESALKDLKQCLKEAGATNVDKLKFNKFTPSLLNLDNIDCAKDLTNIRGKDATTLFTDSEKPETITGTMVNSFGEENAEAMLGDVMTNSAGFGVGQKYCGLSIEGALRPVQTSATAWDRCDELEKGEWRVEFADNRSLEGISVCSATGISTDVDDDSIFADDVVPEESLQTKIEQDYVSWVGAGKPDIPYKQLPKKMGCYCKVNQIDAKWVFNYVATPSGCKTNCAWDCGSRQTGTKIDGKVDFTKTLVTGVHTIYRNN